MLTSPEVLIKPGVDERIDSAVGMSEVIGEEVERWVPVRKLKKFNSSCQSHRLTSNYSSIKFTAAAEWDTGDGRIGTHMALVHPPLSKRTKQLLLHYMHSYFLCMFTVREKYFYLTTHPYRRWYACSHVMCVYLYSLAQSLRRLSNIMLCHAFWGNREKRRQSFTVFLTTVQNYKAVSCTKQPCDWTPMIEIYITNYVYRNTTS